MKTTLIKKEAVTRNWYEVDATGWVLGRLSTRIARVLMGKHKPTYTPAVDCGDFVIVMNAQNIKFTGNKLDDKIYHKHTGYIGGVKETTAKALLAKRPEEVIYQAVKNMLPKSYLGKKMVTKLKIYKDTVHSHKAQMPKPFSEIKNI